MKKVPNIRKEVEFDSFIKIIEDKSIAHWQDIAEAIGVNKDTITEWRKLPEAQDAIAKGIANALDKMENTGKRDWRMWREKLKMLGLIEVQRAELTGKDGKDLPTPILKVDTNVHRNKD